MRVRLVVTPNHACSYLPGRVSRNRAVWADSLPGSLYHRFMDAGFRRSGKVLYQPACGGCRECRSIRVPVATFRPGKSQRRCLRKNADLVVASGRAVATDEKFDLYRRYVTQWHGKDAAEEDRASFESFLYDSPVETVEYTYRDPAGRLLAVGICDVCPESFSTVYFYHNPADARRSLGTFGALYEIEAARGMGIPHYYLGFWINGCGTMDYKSRFRPAEVLHPDGIWRPLEEGAVGDD